MKRFFIGLITLLLVFIAISGTLIVNKLNHIEKAMGKMEQKIIIMDEEFDNNVTIKTDKLDKALNEIMINDYNAANQ